MGYPTEKGGLLEDLEASNAPARPSTSWRRPLATILLAALALHTLDSTTNARAVVHRCLRMTGGGIDWFPCPDNFETSCAYLSVPMDYTNPKPDEVVSLALRKLPATAPVRDRLGTLLINPGGPGGSGTSAVMRFGTQLSIVLQGRYDILSWDPRGVNLTAPALNCFPTPGDGNRYFQDIKKLGLPFEANETSLQMTRGIQRFDSELVALNEACSTHGNEGMIRSSSTAFVVRDMRSILDALGEKKLNYWGFSYGTILGATFSAMFPELVHRVVLDGVSDSAAYTNDMWEWGRSGMHDTQKTMQGFLDNCALSGAAGCALAKINATSSSIEKRIHKLIETLTSRPLPVGQSKFGPGIVTASDVKYTIFDALYSPKTWPQVAKAIADLEAGNGTLLYESAARANADLGRKDADDNVFHRVMDSGAATAAIMCSDTDPAVMNDTSLSTLRSYIDELGSKSPTGEMWAMWIANCRRWSGRATEAYRGPWTVADGLNKTNFPVFFLSMTADPVTPLSAAFSMSKGFGSDSATVVSQNGFGHCSLAMPSLCSAKAVRAYFLEGKVPKYGSECDSDEGFLFPHSEKGKEERLAAMSVEDRELTVALHSLAGQVHELGMKPHRM